MTDEKKKQIKLDFELDLIVKKVETAKKMLAKGYDDGLFLKAGEIETVAQNIMKILDPHMYDKCKS